MAIRRNKQAKALEGVYCLPTSSRSHVHEPNRGTAYKPGQYMYVLLATQSVEEGGYPQRVVLTSDHQITDEEGNPWQVDQEVKTQHAEVRKNLPPRVVEAVIDPEGNLDGSLSNIPKGLGLPHWEYIKTLENGAACMTSVSGVLERIKKNKSDAKAAKEAVRAAKKNGTGNGAPTATQEG